MEDSEHLNKEDYKVLIKREYDLLLQQQVQLTELLDSAKCQIKAQNTQKKN